ncbi:ribonuclease E inhibitor RraB [Ethanoligenens harbinense]|uniref:Regulator of ribonuclease activity B domain-containing protein n=1 Tax=Ethanoligenens harbinense (strain DSM 18485 / JCM 12961 / CGMCC 1.5033 / YUAN-3) TaxID=663278 RepID=E6U810_ETHHY|nr:ribonuclease E inhibitor RraB [Ethanoligenens harbinense]ADU25942.1 hypothetical protein Ethha_0357 [Ethanoligenens harbinense YUAN-3]AVQ95093.1 hypothetical protein CXQ68_01840 [Ethanoligenens harbinense YUAN-3]AYF37784.1 hypothetical protein CXP51_01850 [Ethanoligenens harbinense]AYF40506.1 hypothetical protein CN246_01845 [Ethanoligenens harbinense]QCN91339.1 hypothetical protein DRA42_01850 [Ethanoligenens harbinense]
MADHQPFIVQTGQSHAVRDGCSARMDEAGAQAAETQPRPTYTQMVIHKTLGVYFARPYSLAACSELVRRLRSLAFILLAAAGIAGLVLGAGAPAFSVVWVACGIALVLWGIGVFLFGFARSLLMWPAAVGCAALYTGVRFALSWAWGLSPVLFAALAAFLLAVLAGVIFRLAKRFVIASSVTFWQYERDGILCAADLPLGEMPPVAGYTVFLRGEVPVSFDAEQEPAEEVDILLEDCVFFCRRKRLVFCGYALDARQKRLTLYLYARGVRQSRRAFKRFLKRRGLEASVTCSTDADWQRFHEEVYPDDTEYQQIHNRFLYDNMEADGFDFSQAVPQVYTFYFARREDARAFAEQAVPLGYEGSRYYDREREASVDGDGPAFAHAVCVQLTGRVGLARMDCNTGRAVELARQFHGRFYEWEVGVLEPDASTAST